MAMALIIMVEYWTEELIQKSDSLGQSFMGILVFCEDNSLKLLKIR